MTKRILLGAVASLAMISAAGAQTASGNVEWVDDFTVPASLTGVPGDPVAGAAVVSSRSAGNCIACHGNSAMPTVDFQGNVGPSFDGAGARWGEAELRAILVDAKRIFPESIMPSFYVSDLNRYIRPGNAYTASAADPATFGTLLTAQQVEDAVAYLLTLTEY